MANSLPSDEDEAVFLTEVEDFKIFHRRLPTLQDEAGIWQRIEDRKTKEKNAHEQQSKEELPSPE